MDDLHFLTLFFSFLIYKGSALLCNVCQSFKSWDDCDSNRVVFNCSGEYPQFDVCFKVHRALKSNDSEIHIYTKGCGFHEQCNGGQCKEYGHWCQVDCCNMDECNTSQTLHVTYTAYSFVTLLTTLLFV